MTLQIAWRNPLALLILTFGLAQYAFSGAAWIDYYQAELPEFQVHQSIWLSIGSWLTEPTPVIALAAIVEYLSRIASALQRERGPE